MFVRGRKCREFYNPPFIVVEAAIERDTPIVFFAVFFSIMNLLS